MSNNWYYADSEGTVGPITFQELKGTLATFPDAQRVLVWREGLPDWLRAGDLPDFWAQTTAAPPAPNTRSKSQTKWWRGILALLSFGTVGDGHKGLARASGARTKLRRVGDQGKFIEIARRNHGVIVRPAYFGRWASYGFVVGSLNGALQIQHAWEGDGIRLNLIHLLSMGVGAAIIGIFAAALWNWAGKIR